MESLIDTTQKATLAVHRLREDAHRSGRPFLIIVPGLDPYQSFLEHSDGRVEVVESNDNVTDFKSIKWLSSKEADYILNKAGIKI